MRFRGGRRFARQDAWNYAIGGVFDRRNGRHRRHRGAAGGFHAKCRRNRTQRRDMRGSGRKLRRRWICSRWWSWRRRRSGRHRRPCGRSWIRRRLGGRRRTAKWCRLGGPPLGLFRRRRRAKRSGLRGIAGLLPRLCGKRRAAIAAKRGAFEIRSAALSARRHRSPRFGLPLASRRSPIAPESRLAPSSSSIYVPRPRQGTVIITTTSMKDTTGAPGVNRAGCRSHRAP